MKSELRIGRYSFGLSHFIFAVVFVLRLLVLARLSRSPFLLPSRGDMHFYNDWAQRILHGQTTDHVAFYGLPGYAYLLAFLYKIFGYNPFVLGLLQAGLDAGIAVLIYGLALRTSRVTSRLWKFAIQDQARGVATVAALGWGLFVPAQAYSVILMPTVWIVFAFWLVVWRIVKNDGTPTRRECFWLGLLIGVTAIGVATILIVLPLVFAALLLKSKIDPQRRWQTLLFGAALLLGGVGLGTSPCWIHNYFIARDPVFLSAHSGINFWIGNNPTANGYPRFPPGSACRAGGDARGFSHSSRGGGGHPLKRAEVSDYWSAKAKQYIRRSFRRLVEIARRSSCATSGTRFNMTI